MSDERPCRTCGQLIVGSYVAMKRVGTVDEYDYWHPLCRERWLQRAE